ncbi:hypothetical protein MMC07_008415 [Pseudocyphellaria aurata]|nr:hypothetical protein [Pseudocyphellaria aurata]
MAAQPDESFYGLKGEGYKAREYIEGLEVRVMLMNLSAEKSDRRGLPKERQVGTWTDLKTEFLAKHDNHPSHEEASVEDYLKTIQGVRQAGKSIVQYVRDAEKVHEKCPEALHRMLGKHFIADLDDRTKASVACILLGGEKWVPFPQYKDAVIKAYGTDDGPGPFDRTDETYDDQPSNRY